LGDLKGFASWNEASLLAASGESYFIRRRKVSTDFLKWASQVRIKIVIDGRGTYLDIESCNVTQRTWHQKRTKLRLVRLLFIYTKQNQF